MSSRQVPSTHGTLVRAMLPATLAATALLLGPSAAAADPPERNVACALLLAKAAQWPGTTQTPDGPVRLFSDAYNSYLSSQPVCRSPWHTSGD